MNYDEKTKITVERINDYMTEAVNTDSKGVAEIFHPLTRNGEGMWHSGNSSAGEPHRFIFAT